MVILKAGSYYLYETCVFKILYFEDTSKCECISSFNSCLCAFKFISLAQHHTQTRLYFNLKCLDVLTG